MSGQGGPWHEPVQQAWFPVDLDHLLPNVKVTLNADGTWVADVDEVEKALAKNTDLGGGNVLVRAILWLVLLEMKRQKGK